MSGGEFMSKSIFTDKERALLSQNPYIKKASEKGITYTDEFKRIFVAEHAKGKLPQQIFREYGFDIDLIGQGRVKSSGKRWRAAYKKDSVNGLTDSRKDSSGRPRDKELSIEEKYERLKVKNQLLKAENELLKKIDMLERGLRRKE